MATASLAMAMHRHDDAFVHWWNHMPLPKIHVIEDIDTLTLRHFAVSRGREPTVADDLVTLRRLLRGTLALKTGIEVTHVVIGRLLGRHVGRYEFSWLTNE